MRHQAARGDLPLGAELEDLAENVAFRRALGGVATRAGERLQTRNPYKGLRAFEEADVTWLRDVGRTTGYDLVALDGRDVMRLVAARAQHNDPGIVLVRSRVSSRFARMLEKGGPVPPAPSKDQSGK